MGIKKNQNNSIKIQGAEVNLDPTKNQVKLKERLSYAMSDFGCNTVFQILGTYFLVFATDTFGVAAAAMTGLFALTAVIDSVDGVFWGQFIDRTHTKWGKSRPYWLWFSIPFAFFCVMAFTAPPFLANNQIGKVVWVYIAYICAKVLYSAINIPVTSILPSLTSNPKERVTISTIRQFFGNFGAAIFLPLTLPAVMLIGGWFGDSASGNKSAIGWFLWALLLGIVTVICMMIAFKGTRERVITKDSQRSVPMRESIKALKGNYPWAIIIFINFVYWGGFAIRSSSLPYYFEYNLHRPELGSLTLVGTVLTLLSTAAIPFFAGKIGKRNTMMTGMVMIIVSQLGLAVANTMFGDIQIAIILVSVVVFYLGYGLVGALIAVMLSDAVDFGEWKNGVRAEGFVTSFSSFSAKLGMGLGSMLLTAVLTAGAYISSTAGSETVTQPDSALNAISMGFIWIPFVGFLLSAIALWFNDIDKKEKQMMSDLEEKHKKELV
ncbi:MAG: glycoside-pentoside-hexuronide (GPH):cation symporter [Candidatus Ancillula sp.]|jgi:GPH family glycoside/pentoside/hexuronide:cation symporter|nr:glycoside-pentoside-hexuronide (GPH):cation symporter [Candidatus Ancillula sp.]